MLSSRRLCNLNLREVGGSIPPSPPNRFCIPQTSFCMCVSGAGVPGGARGACGTRGPRIGIARVTRSPLPRFWRSAERVLVVFRLLRSIWPRSGCARRPSPRNGALKKPSRRVTGVRALATRPPRLRTRPAAARARWCKLERSKRAIGVASGVRVSRTGAGGEPVRRESSVARKRRALSPRSAERKAARACARSLEEGA